MTPEGELVEHAKKECLRLNLRFIRNHKGPGAEVGWPDIIILGTPGKGGYVMWLETKRPGEPLRPIQQHRFDEITERGGMPRKADSKADVTHHLEMFAKVCEYEREMRWPEGQLF